MKRFNVTVNGKAYDVAVEEIAEGSAPVMAASVPAAAPVAAPAPAPVAAAPQVAPVGEGTKVCAPMPGTILDIKLSVGTEVKRGDVIFILEAMKMENDIVAPCNGKITSITVNKGDTVNSADVLATVQ